MDRGRTSVFVLILAGYIAGCGDGDGTVAVTPRYEYAPETITYYVFDGSAWTEQRREAFTYDAGKRIVTIDSERYTAGVWVDGGSVTYTYDGVGRLVGRRDRYYMLETEFVHSTSYSYDPAGRLGRTTSEQVYPVGGMVSETVYQYDTGGRLITKETYDSFSDDASWRVSYFYDAGGQVEMEVNYAYYQGNWVARYRDCYSYDAEGRIVEKRQDLFRQDAWAPDTLNTYSFDAEGRLVAQARWKHSGLAWEQTHRYSLSYSADGRLAVVSREFYDKPAGTWQSDYMHEIVFTDDGSSYALQGPWSPEPFAEWVLVYYGEGNVNRYLWQ